MDVTRRQFVGTGLVAAAAFFGLPQIASAEGLEDAINAFTGGAEAGSDGITLIAPEIAENGNTVPIEVDAPGAEAIMLLAAGNPNPDVVPPSTSVRRPDVRRRPRGSVWPVSRT
jgi:sulfur-oxidizing protein SoxY